MSGKPSDHIAGVNPRLFSTPRSFSLIIWTSLILVLIISSLDITGWMFNLTVLKSIGPRWEPMKLVTAFCFDMSVLSLVIIRLDFHKTFTKTVSIFFALLICLISLLSLYAYFYLLKTLHEPPITQISFLSYFISSGNRMALLTSFCFFFTGVILLLLQSTKDIASGIAHLFIIPVFLISYFTLISYMLGVSNVTAISQRSVALNTGIALSALGIAVLHMRPRSWLMKLYSKDNTGGIISRRLLLPAVLLPIIIGWLRIQGERKGLFVSEQGVVIVAITYTFCFVVMVWVTSRYVNKIDYKRKTSEEILRVNREQLTAVFNGVSETLMLVDIHGNIITANSTARSRFSDDNSELEGKNIYDLIPSRFREQRREQIAEIIRTKKPVKVQDTMRDTLLDLNLYPVFDDHGNVIQCVSFAIDITERKKAETALQESEVKFYSIFHLSPVAMVLSSLEDGKYHDVNSVFIKDTGYSKEEIVGKSSEDLNIFSDNKERDRIVNQVKSDGQIYGVQCNFRLKNGEILPCLISINIISINGAMFLLSTIQDISEITKTREALKMSEERFKAIAEVSPVGMGVLEEEDGSFLYINPAYEQFFGYDRDELLTRKAPDIYWNEAEREKMFELLKRNNFVSNYEVMLKRKNGSSFWSMSSIRRINFMNKSALLGTFIDISERKKAEDSLRKSEQRLKSHIENSPLAVIEWGADFVVTKWSDEAEHIFGWDRTEVIGLRIDKLNMIFEEDIPIVEKTMDRLSGGKELKVVSENRNYTKTREIRNCIWYNSVLLDEQRQMSSVMSLVEDVTEVRRVEKLLKESEEKLWSVLNATQESIYMFDRNGIITMSNTIGMDRMNITAEDKLIGHHFSEFMSPVTAGKSQAKLDEVFSTGKPMEFEDERGDRLYNHNFFPVFKDDKVSYVVTYSTDITNRKIAEANLKESEDRFRTIAESLPVLIAIYDIEESNFSFVNESFEKAFGINNGDLRDRKLREYFFDPHDRMELGDILKEKGKAYNKELRVNKSDGTSFWIMTSIRKIMFMNEQAYLTASINITETKKTHEELLRLNRTLNAKSKSSQAMMHSKNEFIFLHDVCKIIIEDCGHTMAWVGYAQDDQQKTVKPVACFGADDVYIEQVKVTWSDTERGRGPSGTVIRTGKPALCKNILTDPSFKPWREAALGRGYASLLSLPLILEGKPFGSISIYSKEPDPFSASEINLLSDLADDLAYGISYIRLEESERATASLIKENEAKLKELIATKDKFFNIVAHDLKNPFTSLLGSSELLFENINDLNKTGIRDLASILNDSAKSGYSILQNLLDWSRSQTGILKINPENVNLRNLINENLSTLQLHAANKEIKMHNMVNKDIFVYSDKNMINTILRNLLSNALKFTRKSGKVIVSTSVSRKEIIISVKDDGIGIPKEKIESLFNIEVKNSMPGTENEQGTGLGLKLSKEFVEKLNGRIWVESTENKGSIFSFSIPANGLSE